MAQGAVLASLFRHLAAFCGFLWISSSPKTFRALMIAELKSIPEIWKRMPSQKHARRFLEGIIWSTGKHCPHCASMASSALRGRTCRPGLYQCRDCHLQFTVTTLTPMHGTKLDLRI